MSWDVIKDAVKNLAISLRVATLFPAALLVLVNTYVIVPEVMPDADKTSSSSLALMASLTLILSYMFYVSGFRLMRFFTGYSLKQTDIGEWLLQKKRAKFQELLRQIEALTIERLRFKNRLGFDPDETDAPVLSKETSEYWQRLKADRLRLEDELEFYYPSSDTGLLPTKLGNTVAAVWAYPLTRYGMDAEVLWSRLGPVLVESDSSDSVGRDRDALDFLMNTCVVVALLGVEFLYLNLFLGRMLLSLLVCALTIALCAFLYTGMVYGAYRWGVAVRAAFDLHRYELHQRLGLLPTKTFKEEYDRWQQVSLFFLYRRRGTWFTGFISQDEMEKKEAGEERKRTEEETKEEKQPGQASKAG